MSVRPITVGEETKAFGHPWVNILSLFGGTQGLLIFLHRQRVSFRSNWFANPGSLPVFGILVVGGYVTGGLLAMAAFNDNALLRLWKSHQEDKALNVEGQSIRNLTV